MLKTESFLDVVVVVVVDDPGEESPTTATAAAVGVGVGFKFVLATDVDAKGGGGVLGESIFRKFESFLSLESHLLLLRGTFLWAV